MTQLPQSHEVTVQWQSEQTCRHVNNCIETTQILSLPLFPTITTQVDGIEFHSGEEQNRIRRRSLSPDRWLRTWLSLAPPPVAVVDVGVVVVVPLWSVFQLTLVTSSGPGSLSFGKHLQLPVAKAEIAHFYGSRNIK